MNLTMRWTGERGWPNETVKQREGNRRQHDLSPTCSGCQPNVCSASGGLSAIIGVYTGILSGFPVDLGDFFPAINLVHCFSSFDALWSSGKDYSQQTIFRSLAMVSFRVGHLHIWK